MEIDIYGIGNALLDIEMQVSEDLLKNNRIDKGLMTLIEKERHDDLLQILEKYSMKMSCGGSAANTVIALADLGMKAFYSCKVANDKTGKYYQNDMKSKGVRSNLEEEEFKGTTGKCIVLVTPDADRTMNSYLGISSTFSRNEIKAKELKKSKWLYIEGYLATGENSKEAAIYAREIAEENGVKVALTFSDPFIVSSFRDSFKEIIGKNKLDLLFCNEQEGLSFTNTSNIDAAFMDLKEYAKTFVITLGSKGAIIYDGENKIYVAGLKSNAISTNGAGDIFAGSFLYAILEGENYNEAGKFANNCSARLVEKFGARLEKEEILKIKESILDKKNEDFNKKSKHIFLKEAFTNEKLIGCNIVVKGWVQSVRKSKKFSFIIINDGSSQNNLQIIADSHVENYEDLSMMLTGSAIEITGKLVKSQGKGQGLELVALKGKIIGKVDESYPLQKKETSLENLRKFSHLRARTGLFRAIFRVRHELAMATHQFFSKEGFYYMNTPIITSVDGEGAGEMFRVTTRDLENVVENSKLRESQDYFKKKTSLCVTGQLEAECGALGLGAVYTFGPTFRSENSNTKRHLAEFWMVEPEIAFADLDDVAVIATNYIKYMINHILSVCSEEIKYLHKTSFTDVDENHIEVLKQVRDSDFKKITYTNAVEILINSKEKFEVLPKWGEELQTEHEKYLTDKIFFSPVIVTDYPMDCKSFYMKQNEDGKTVRAMDILVPGIGELVGGSQREEDLDKLVKRMNDLKMDTASYWWYLELRKFGSVPHSGFGLGFARALMYITGMSNIRDVIPFPRTPGNCDF